MASAVAAVSVAFVPGVDVVAGVVAITAGGVAAGEYASQGRGGSAALDVIGIGLSGFAVGDALSAARDALAARRLVNGYGYLPDIVEKRAADVAATSTLFGRLAARAGGASFLLSNVLSAQRPLAAGAETTTARSYSAPVVCT